VETQVRAYLDNCADLRASHPTWCPFGPSIEVAAADIQWRVTEYPTVNLMLDSVGDVDMTHAGGRAVATGHSDTPDRAPFTREVTFRMGGHIFVTAGKAVLFPTP
jgi:sortase (surface protein transpeptidase)